MKFEGIYPPVITPYKNDGSIDRDGFVLMIEHLIDSGVHGIIVGGTTGEFYAQSKEEIWVTSLQNFLIIAFGAAFISVCIAWPISYAIWRRRDPISKTIAGMATLPFALPPIVFGVGLSFLWIFTGGLGDMWAGMLSHAAFFTALP